MRDPARIDEILEALGEFWHAHPDLRFGQLAPWFGWNYNTEDAVTLRELSKENEHARHLRRANEEATESKPQDKPQTATELLAALFQKLDDLRPVVITLTKAGESLLKSATKD